MRNGHHDVDSILFGSSEQTAVDRGVAEIRAGRPVRIQAAAQDIIAFPVEGLTSERLAAFKALAGTNTLRLIITARRARALGLEASGAIFLAMDADVTGNRIMGLVADAQARHRPEGAAAGAADTAAIELAKLARSLPAVLATEAPTVSAPGPAIVTIRAEAVAAFRETVIHSLTIAGEGRVPLATGGTTRFVVFRDATGDNSVAVVIGTPDLRQPVQVRLHSACLTGDVFGSRRCDCGDQLRLAMVRLKTTGGGVILYLAQEGRGLGLANKMRAYMLQDAGLDTIDANTTLGFDDDERDYGIAARMLELLGITRVRLLTNNPAKVVGLQQAGIEVTSRVPIEAPVNADNHRYLETKAARAGHQLDHFMSALSGP